MAYVKTFTAGKAVLHIITVDSSIHTKAEALTSIGTTADASFKVSLGPVSIEERTKGYCPFLVLVVVLDLMIPTS